MTRRLTAVLLAALALTCAAAAPAPAAHVKPTSFDWCC